MNHRSQSERLIEALAKVMQHWQSRRKAEGRQVDGPGRSSRAFTIALSRESGARGTSTAREVGARLGWAVYDHELLERIAQEMNLRTSLLESVDERKVSWLQECVEAFASVPWGVRSPVKWAVAKPAPRAIPRASSTRRGTSRRGGRACASMKVSSVAKSRSPQFSRYSLAGQVALGIFGEAHLALRDAEVVRLAAIRHLRGGECLVDPHAADRVRHHGPLLMVVGLAAFPEVERVFGKAGRAETSTDPAPFSMMEITIVLKPHDKWRKVRRWYSDLPGWVQGPCRRIWPDRIST
jgi:hypothetical protein